MESELLAKIRSIPDFPKKGIVFRDVTTLLKDGRAFARVVELLYEHYKNERVGKVASVESRGFIFGAALAYKLRAGFVPMRKPGKLPAETIREEYALEYGKDSIEVHRDAIVSGERILLLDDLLATGGTMAAACKLVRRLGGTIVGVAFVIELSFLGGRKLLDEKNIYTLLHYDSE